MTCSEQSGLWKIELYENVDATIIRSNEGVADILIGSGRYLSFEECENLSLNYSVKDVFGSNSRLSYEHSVNFSLFGFASAYPELDTLASLYGWIPVLSFRNGEKYIINSPIIKQRTSYEENNTQVYPLTLKSEVSTFKSLEKFADLPVVWVLEDGLWSGADTYWTADGIWNTI